MISCVLKHWHPMIGVDLHIPWPPASPMPAPMPVPYRTCAMMRWTDITTLWAPSTLTVWGYSMVRLTDIGPLIPHAGPPSLLTPLDMAFSASKSYFGSHRIKVKDQHGSEGDLAAAAGVVVNPNWNCGSPLPLGIGLVIAPSTHIIDVDLSDYATALREFLVDFLIQSILQIAISAFFTWLGPSLGRIIGRQMGIGLKSSLSRGVARNAAREYWKRNLKKSVSLTQAARILKDMDEAALKLLIEQTKAISAPVFSFIVGSPQGQSMGNYNEKEWSPYGASRKCVEGYLNSNKVEEIQK